MTNRSVILAMNSPEVQVLTSRASDEMARETSACYFSTVVSETVHNGTLAGGFLRHDFRKMTFLII